MTENTHFLDSPEDTEKIDSLQILYKSCLGALRSREREVFQFLGFIAPTLAGFIWLIYTRGKNIDPTIFGFVSLGMFLLLLVGGCYFAALGYHYRYLLVRIAVLEKALGIPDNVRGSWPKTRKQLREMVSLFHCIPWSSPPEIIKIFWYTFLGLQVFLMIGTWMFASNSEIKCLGIFAGIVCLLVSGIFVPFFYGSKLHKSIDKEDLLEK